MTDGEKVAAESASPEPPPVVSPPPLRAGLSQRELLAGAGAALAVGVLILGVLMGRGTPSPEVAAADAAATAPAAPAATLPDAPAPLPADTVKWSSANRVHWTGTARNSAAFELHAENMVGIWMRQVRPLLVVRCVANRTEAFVITDSALKIEPQTDDHTVTYSFDNEPETRERWPDADDHNAVFAPEPVSFTQRLIGARTLRFGYTPHNVAPVVAHFHVNGLGPLIEPAGKSCGWTR